MPFSSDYTTAAILIKIELPDRTVRVCDGGVVIFNGEEGDNTAYVYNSEDELYGTIYGGEALTEGEGDEVPASAISFLPKGNESTQALTQPNMQRSPISLWFVSLDPLTHIVVEKEDWFFGVIDIPTFRETSEGRVVDMSLVSLTELFFRSNDGNRMSEENHKRVNPGELGLDNMTGVEVDVPWGVETRPRNTGGSGQGSGSGGGTNTLGGGISYR